MDAVFSSITHSLSITPYSKVFDYGADLISIVVQFPVSITESQLNTLEFKVHSVDKDSESENLLITHCYVSSDEYPNRPSSHGVYLHIELEHGPLVKGVKCLKWHDDTFSNQLAIIKLSIYVREKKRVSEQSDYREILTHTLPLRCLDTVSFFSDMQCGLNFRYYVPKEEFKKPSLIIWLHGAGEGGESNCTHIMANKGATSFTDINVQQMFDGLHVLAPQCPTFWCPKLTVEGRILEGKEDYTLSLLKLVELYLLRYSEIDQQRVYLAGASMGGYQVWQLLLEKGSRFSGAILSCPAFLPEDEDILAVKSLPLWFVHSALDTTIPVETSRVAVEKLKLLGANVEYSEYQTIHLDGVTYDPHASYFYMLKNQPMNKKAKRFFNGYHNKFIPKF